MNILKKTDRLGAVMDKKVTITVDETLAGQRIDSILKTHMGFSGALIIGLKKTSDGIMLNGERANANVKTQKGDILSVTIHSEKSSDIMPVKMPLDILYEDDDIIVVNKPHSMPTHPTRRHLDDTLANGIMYYFKNRNFIFHAITRLDRDTSGIVLIAKNPLVAQILSEEMKNKKIYKEYVAVVNGVPKNPSGRICAPIRRKENGGILREVASCGKEAVTEYEVEKSFVGVSLVRLKPITGRTHQLRVHMSHIGNPIYGDYMYDAPQKGERTRLHCEKITFKHPFREDEITVKAPIPYDIKTLIE